MKSDKNLHLIVNNQKGDSKIQANQILTPETRLFETPFQALLFINLGKRDGVKRGSEYEIVGQVC